ncbi:MAG: DUF3536 domain-containing protein [candidate division Zixibacteria bacterium]|nr:DUF3536 domain-containing protein [candidate division Zixibacteria bacterium]
MTRYICIHGHFYQPPRENPWLEAIELQDSAYPYHDWNERIDSECYSPNAASRILDQDGLINRIVSNYEKISFDFGPTLLSWMEDKAPETYQAVLEADFESLKSFSGHGSAIAQAYNHMIMPLANRRDKITQIAWGLRDFQYRFRRASEGIWLPETAVDLETLDIASEYGIRFVILAPHQARRMRRIGERDWQDIQSGGIDTTRPYLLRLPSRRELAIFFYDGPASRAVAFERLLDNGIYFADRILSGLSSSRPEAQLAHIATDGETYGHHHRFGDMGLAYAIQHIESNKLATLTNYGEFLEKHPPAHEVEIIENTSWSCAHGVERWRSSCGCNTGAHPRWNQAWRGPLRQALDWLRDTIAPLFENGAGALLRSPWQARNDYIDVILDRSNDSIDRFFAKHAAHPLNPAETTAALALLEMQRNAMLMYTSCGWFFDDISGIETVQILQYAGRTIQIAEFVSGQPLESQFLALLEKAPSNLPEQSNGRRIWERKVNPAVVTLAKVGAQYAVSSLFDGAQPDDKIACYSTERIEATDRQSGRTRLATGRVRVTCDLTRQSAVLGYSVIHFGGPNIAGGVLTNPDPQLFLSISREMTVAFAQADYALMLRLLDREYGQNVYSLRSLFRDEQRRILGIILENTLAEAETIYRDLYRDHGSLMQFVREMGIPLPVALKTAAEFVLNTDLRSTLGKSEVDLDQLEVQLREARTAGVALDAPGLAYAFRRLLELMIEDFFESPADLKLLEKLVRAAAMSRTLPISLDLQKVQNTFWELRQWSYPDFRQRSIAGDANASSWVEHFSALGNSLGVRVG